jgi:Spy/CpxP family protein refolding chaperone
MEGLNLTESQKADIKKIREEQKSQMETLKSSGQSQEDIQKQRKAIMETYTEPKCRHVLTTEQKEKMKEQRLNNRKENKSAKSRKTQTGPKPE